MNIRGEKVLIPVRKFFLNSAVVHAYLRDRHCLVVHAYLGDRHCLVERLSGYLIADKLDIVSADIVAKKITKRFEKLPKRKRMGIIYDNGTEFSAHEMIEKKTKAIVYFVNPYHSWERRTNENTNGLLQQFFQKKSSFATVNQGDVDKTTKLLNRRPWKRLCYLTPKKMFHCASF